MKGEGTAFSSKKPKAKKLFSAGFLKVFGARLAKLTWCCNGLQSGSAVVVPGCFASCGILNDGQMRNHLSSAAAFWLLQKQEEFVHNTRCANISQALLVGVGQSSQ